MGELKKRKSVVAKVKDAFSDSPHRMLVATIPISFVPKP